jgi:pilus assembly protein Flp/PilA
MLFAPNEEGQGLVEYALILILVAIVVVAILTVFGTTLGKAYSGIVNAI